PETIRRQRFGPGLPPESHAAAELSVPKPATITRQAWDDRAVEQRERLALRLLVDQTREKAVGIRRNARQLLIDRGRTSHVVGRPTSLKRVDVPGQILA